MVILQLETFLSEKSAKRSVNMLSKAGRVFAGSRCVITVINGQRSDLPLIVSLEVHTSPQQQQVMVDIMKEEWGSHLVDAVVDDTTPLPTLESMRKRILIKVKYSAPTEKAKKKAQSSSGAEVEGDSSDDEGQTEAVKSGHIIPELGSMGMYTRSYHFNSFDQPEAKLPCHVFALSEKKLIETQRKDPYGLFMHNKVRTQILTNTLWND